MNIQKLLSILPKTIYKKITPLKIKTIRAKYNATQVVFASMLGVSYHTYKNWEIGHRIPSTPAVSLLIIADNFPNIFLKHGHSLRAQLEKLI